MQTARSGELMLVPATEIADAGAVWVAGSDAEVWLDAAGSDEVTIYPTVMSDGKLIGGLLVGASSGRGVGFQQLAGKLWIPADGTIEPPVAVEELDAKLDEFDVYVWHPMTGLLGFDAVDAIRPVDLIRAPAIADDRWDSAIDVPPPGAGLKEIRPPATPMDDIASEIGGEAGTSPTQSVTTTIGRAASSIGGGLIDAAKSIAGRGKPVDANTNENGANPSGDDRAGAEQGGERPSASERLADAIGSLSKTVGELMSARHRAISRLLNTLETDPDEGLRYALPMGTGGGGRTDVGDAKLRRQSTDFDINWLQDRGSGSSQVWDVPDDLRYELRVKYRELAQREMRLGRHRRAAYVYAHLLGDEQSAAVALRAGGHYVDAGDLYHSLGVPIAAAECYEAAGLFSKAITVLDRSKQFERLASLHERLEQWDDAALAWNWAVEHAIDRDDPLHAAKLLETKLNAGDQALTVLETGWDGDSDRCPSRKDRQCLAESIRLAGRLGEHERLKSRLVELASRPEPLKRRLTLAGELSEIAATYPTEAVRRAIRDAVTHVASAELRHARQRSILKKDTDRLLAAVSRLHPADRLIARDTTRFAAALAEPKPPQPKRASNIAGSRPKPRMPIHLDTVETFRLPPFATYRALRTDDEGFVSVGVTRTELWLSRGYWSDLRGTHERATCYFDSEGEPPIHLLGGTREPIVAVMDAGLSERQQKRMRLLDLNIGSPNAVVFPRPDWLPPDLLAICQTSGGFITIDATRTARRHERDGRVIGIDEGLSDFALQGALASGEDRDPLVEPVFLASSGRYRSPIFMAAGDGVKVFNFIHAIGKSEPIAIESEATNATPLRSLTAGFWPGEHSDEHVATASYEDTVQIVIAYRDDGVTKTLQADRGVACVLPGRRVAIVDTHGWQVVWFDGWEIANRKSGRWGTECEPVGLGATDSFNRVAMLTADGNLSLLQLPDV